MEAQDTSSSVSICPVCSLTVKGNLNAHVNNCLDRMQEQASLQAVREMSATDASLQQGLVNSLQDIPPTRASATTQEKEGGKEGGSDAKRRRIVIALDDSSSEEGPEMEQNILPPATKTTSLHTPRHVVTDPVAKLRLQFTKETGRGVPHVVKRLRLSLRKEARREKFKTYLCIDNVTYYWQARGLHRCGYRNLQMLISPYLDQASPLKCANPQCFDVTRGMPNPGALREFLAFAWAQGFDEAGERALDTRTTGAWEWIGATDVSAILHSLGIATKLIDFHQPSSDADNRYVFNWVWDYFHQHYDTAASINDTPKGESRNAFDVLCAGPEVHTIPVPPLYLQSAGHSRTIVGIEKCVRTGEHTLLILDPMKGGYKLEADVSAEHPKLVRVPKLKGEQYQIVMIDVLNTPLVGIQLEHAKVLRSMRIP